ncbi:hypothetical protein POM88_009093 [Heracleum sosnowskyi]|uniref:histidine kinase n=1 Tax=Heracleum sosnowskyi TaxID=360622 RepID=A0AAD8J7F4_9APIA|nr:hypothetical protein POM88_009093 [Heracleum sosnowskyi]
MECNCIEPQWPADEILMKYQYISDFFIALAYFSIPLELIYFVKKSAVFPYKWVFVQFGAFIVLCGATHLINLWTFSIHTKTVAIVMTTAKILTAAVSCATALTLVHIIPDLLSVKTRELFLKNKAAELDREMGLIRTQEETGRHVRMLTHEIRSTLDRHTILKTTLVELGRTLALEECALWMPTRTGLELQLSYTLRHQNPVGFTVPIQLPWEIYAWRGGCSSARQWHVHEMELVEVVADQVAVALSHAAILEESMRARDLLMEQNVALDLARREAETAIRARNDFLAVMNHEMRTPMHAIIALSSLLQETDLTPEQRLMVETILKSSNLLATLINDVLDLSRLEDGSLELDIGTFNLHALFREVFNLVKPIATVKKLFISLSLASDLPEYAIGDEKRLMQTILNVVGNAVKFSKEGSILISAFVAKPDSIRDPRAPDNFPMPADSNHFYLQVQVKDSGSGIDPQDIPKLFTKFAEGKALATNNSGGTGLGLAICKRFVHLMGGHIYLESEGIGKGSTAVFVVKLGFPQRSSDSKLPFVPGPILSASQGRTNFPGLKVLVMAENGVSRSVTKGLLVHLGCDITIVGSGDECLGALTPEHRLILLDMNLPGTDSYELAVLIREKISTRHERPFVVALTGTADRVMKENCMRVGKDDAHESEELFSVNSKSTTA